MSERPCVAVVNCGSSKVPEIVHVLTLCGADSLVIEPSNLATIKSALPSAIVLSGNPALIKDTGTDFLDDFEALRDVTIPILGICFGHQVIGLLHGGNVTLGREDRELRRMNVLAANPLFTGISADGEFQQDHTEEVSLPAGFLHLASSSHCFNEAMMHPTLPLFGVQFHPEISGETGEQLMRNFLAQI